MIHPWNEQAHPQLVSFSGPRTPRLLAGSYLKLLPTRRTQEVLTVWVPEHMQPQLVGAAEGLVALRTLVDLFRVEASHVFFHLAARTQKVRGNDQRQLSDARGSQTPCRGSSSTWPGSQSGVTDNGPQQHYPHHRGQKALPTSTSHRTWRGRRKCSLSPSPDHVEPIFLSFFFKIKSKSSLGFKWILVKSTYKRTKNNSFSLFPASNMYRSNLAPCSNWSFYIFLSNQVLKN